MQGVILAAGKGTRLHPVTASRSKAMMPILGKPIVARIMDGLRHQGVCRFVVVISPDDSDIVAHFTSLSSDVSEVTFVTQAERLGMAHALQQAVPYLDEAFVLTACDNLVPSSHISELIYTHSSNACAQATLSLMRVPQKKISQTGIVALEHGKVTQIVEKPDPDNAPSNISSLPLYVFSPRILDFLPDIVPSRRGEIELQDGIQMLIDQVGGVRGVFVDRRHTLTTAQDLLEINRHYLNECGAICIPESLRGAVKLIPPVQIDEGVTIGGNCQIGPAVYIERGAVVGDNARIRDAIVLSGAAVSTGSDLLGQVVA